MPAAADPGHVNDLLCTLLMMLKQGMHMPWKVHDRHHSELHAIASVVALLQIFCHDCTACLRMDQTQLGVSFCGGQLGVSSCGATLSAASIKLAFAFATLQATLGHASQQVYQDLTAMHT